MSETTTAGLWFIRDSAGLADLCRGLDSAPVLAVDTEFERSRTYFAELCLVQVAAGEVIACIDPMALPDLGPLFAVFAGGAGPKVLHAARQDLEVIYQSGGCLPQPVFDTQIAAALCGYAEQIGYADLVRELLGVSLAKSATRTDWRQRPLSAEQLDYAADDVRYLAPLAERLTARLEALGREPWLAEDCRALLNPELYAPPPAAAWQRVKGMGAMGGQARARAIVLAEWREREARAQNLPRNWVVRDNELLDIAARDASSLRDLSGLDTLNPGTVRRYGRALIEAMASAGAMPEAAAPERRLNAAGRTALKQLAGAVQARASRLGISPSLLATRSELEATLAARPPARLAGGWRHALLGDLLEDCVVRGGAGLCE